jgi:hypothetical protein
MRQGHQNRRGRGRGNQSNNNNNNNNRKGQNPLTRTFESNGPDVKIRGTPAHIAEKYISLARDAKASGDEVLAENYLQHAEHYNRIILAFRDQQISQGGDPAAGGMGQRYRVPQLQDGPDDDFGEEGDDFGSGDQPNVMRPNEPQPGMQQPPSFGEAGERQEQPQHQRYERQDGREFRPQDGRQDRQDRQGGHRYDDRQRRHDHFRNRDRDRGEGRQDFRQGSQDRGYDRGPDRDRNDRGPDRGFDRNGQDRGGHERDRGGERPVMDRTPVERPAMERPAERPMAPVPAVEAEGFVAERAAPPAVVVAAPESAFESGPVNGPRPARSEAVPRRRERFAQSQHEQPEFLRRPVRRPRRETAPEGADREGGAPASEVPAVPVRDDGGSTE